ncbi:MAG: DUF2555 domain-containing protein [Elainellaceae cyanobacterium]
MTTSTISQHDIENITERDIDQLAMRLEQDEYSSPFDGLQDWHLLRAIAFQRPDMVETYMHLLDLEAYDES